MRYVSACRGINPHQVAAEEVFDSSQHSLKDYAAALQLFFEQAGRLEALYKTGLEHWSDGCGDAEDALDTFVEVLAEMIQLAALAKMAPATAPAPVLAPAPVPADPDAPDAATAAMDGLEENKTKAGRTSMEAELGVMEAEGASPSPIQGNSVLSQLHKEQHELEHQKQQAEAELEAAQAAVSGGGVAAGDGGHTLETAGDLSVSLWPPLVKVASFYSFACPCGGAAFCSPLPFSFPSSHQLTHAPL